MISRQRCPGVFMANDTQLAARIRKYFSSAKTAAIVEKEMFGGLAFLMRGNMCVGTAGQRLMARVGPANYDAALRDMHATVMDVTGKPLRGFVYVEPEALTTEKGLHNWIARCEAFVKKLPPK